MWPRLKRRWEFDLVYERGRKRVGGALVLFHWTEAPDSRIAFVASRKVGIAVQRNRAKRVLRAAFRLSQDPLPAPRGWIILVARREIASLGSGAVADELRTMFADLAASAGGSTPDRSAP